MQNFPPKTRPRSWHIGNPMSLIPLLQGLLLTHPSCFSKTRNWMLFGWVTANVSLHPLGSWQSLVFLLLVLCPSAALHLRRPYNFNLYQVFFSNWSRARLFTSNVVWSSLRRSLRVEGSVSVACVCDKLRSFHHWSHCICSIALTWTDSGFDSFLTFFRGSCNWWISRFGFKFYLIEIDTQHEIVPKEDSCLLWLMYAALKGLKLGFRGFCLWVQVLPY